MQIDLVVAMLEPERTKALRNKLLIAAGEQIRIAATEAAHLPERVAQLQPDVLLLEHEPGGTNSTRRLLDAARSCSSGPLRVLLLCGACQDSSLLEAVRLGAHGCVASDLDSSMVAKAVRCVAAGQVWFPREWMLRQLVEQAGEPVRGAAPGSDQEQKVTVREREILALIGSGMTNKEIGRQLNISDKTVQTQLHRIYIKLHARGRYKAFAILHGHGLKPSAPLSADWQR